MGFCEGDNDEDGFLALPDPVDAWLKFNWPDAHFDEEREALRDLLNEVVEACALVAERTELTNANACETIAAAIRASLFTRKGGTDG